MVACLDALENLKRLEQKEITWDAVADSLEDAIEALDVADHHLLRGTSCQFHRTFKLLAYMLITYRMQVVWLSRAPFAFLSMHLTANGPYTDTCW